MYTESQLKIQKQLFAVCNELQGTIEKIKDETYQLGWQQRDQLISHVYSDYTNDEKLNVARDKWRKSLNEVKILDWIYLVFQNERDEYGYFKNPSLINEQIQTLLHKAEVMEYYEAANILKIWSDKIDLSSHSLSDPWDSYTKQKQLVLYHWEKLIKELAKLLILAKKRGGTLGHRVGSIRARLIDMKSRIENY